MVDPVVKLIGDKRLARKFKNMEPKLQKKILRSSLRKAARPIQQAAKQNVPVQSGDLRRSIKIRAAKRSRRTRNQVGIRISTNSGDNLFQGQTFYGGFLEFGTSRIAPVAFMKRAFDETRGQVMAIMREETKTAIREASRRRR